MLNLKHLYVTNIEMVKLSENYQDKQKVKEEQFNIFYLETKYK